MLVRKYQGSSLDEALKAVKADLGIQAVILKTEKFSGLKGALKNTQYEVTAGIKEDLVEKKVTNSEQFEANERDKLADEKKEVVSSPIVESSPFEDDSNSYLNQMNHLQDKIEVQIDEQNEIIAQLRAEIHSLRSEIQGFQKTNTSLKSLKDNLRSFDLSEKLVNDLLHKLKFEFDNDQKISDDQIHDFLKREISKLIKVQAAKFSWVEFKNKPVITILLSSGNSGQTSMVHKMAHLSDKPFIIHHGESTANQLRSFHEEVLNIPFSKTNSLQDLIKNLNEHYKEERHIFVDIKTVAANREELKRIIQSIKMSFETVDVVLSLSCLHNETYNLRECHRYGDIIDGLSMSFLDMSLNLTTLANLQHQLDFPYYFFGIGAVIPKDIEEANAQRVLSEIFDL